MDPMNAYSYRQPANHTLHLILTLITCGVWAPVWIIMATAGRKTVNPYYGSQIVIHQQPPQQPPQAPRGQYPPPPPYPPGQFGPPPQQ